MAFDDPATIEFDMGGVPSLYRKMAFKFQANMEAPCKVQIFISDTGSKRANGMLVTMGEDGIKNLRAMCEKAIQYFELAKKNPRNIPEREVV